MSRSAISLLPLRSPPLRPTLVDYVLLLAGVSLSLYLMQLAPLNARGNEEAGSSSLTQFVAFLPVPLRLTEGVLLLWPFFYITQRVRRRREPLTGAEWLWVISWIGVAVLTGLAALESTGTLPEVLQRNAELPRKLWYLIFVPSMAGLAVVLGVAGLLRRGPAPWTHTFGLALILWPVAPLAGILMLGGFV